MNSLKILIAITVLISLLGAFSPPIQFLLSLTTASLQHLYLWQPITYLFVHPSLGGVSFPFLIHLAFNMYLLWAFGNSLMERTRPIFFYLLYFGSGFFAALAALAIMPFLMHSYPLAGSSPALYALLIAWVMLNPESDLLLFFAIPFKARWILLGLIAANLLIDLSNADWISLTAYLSSTLFGYFYTLVAFRTESPFPILNSFERIIFRSLDRLAKIGKKQPRQPKIYDIRSGNQILNDEQFMDAMLAKISRSGEHSLTLEEKSRMKAISNKKPLRR